MHEGEREVEPSLHASRVAAHLAIGGLGEPDAFEEELATLRALGAREALQGRLQAEMLAAGEQRVEGGLLQRRPDRGPHLRAFVDDVEAGHASRSRGRGQERRQHVHGCRLPGPVRAEEAVDLPRVHEEVDAVHRARALLELPHEPFRLDPVLVGHPCRLVG